MLSFRMYKLVLNLNIVMSAKSYGISHHSKILINKTTLKMYKTTVKAINYK